MTLLQNISHVHQRDTFAYFTAVQKNTIIKNNTLIISLTYSSALVYSTLGSLMAYRMKYTAMKVNK